MAPATPKQAKGLKWLFWTAFYSTVFSFLSLFVAFATPYWIQSWRRVHSPLANTGLWEICLSGYIKPRDPTLQAYVGCWWIHTTVFHDITASIMPSWFMLVQAFTIICLVCIIAAAIILGLFRPEGTRKRLYKENQHRMMFVNAALLLLSAAMIFIDSLVFAMKTKNPNWMPRPHLNYLSWSYGFNVLAGFFAAYAGICATLIALVLLEMKEEGTMPWQPRVEASKPVQTYPITPSEMSDQRSYGSQSQVSQSYAPQKPYSSQYYPSSTPIDRYPVEVGEKPYSSNYKPTTAPIRNAEPQQDYSMPKKPYISEYKPSKPPIASYQSPRYNSGASPAGYSVAVKRTPKSHDDTIESDV